MSQAGGVYTVMILFIAVTLYYLWTYPRIQPFEQDPAQVDYAESLALPLTLTNSVGASLRLIPAGIYERGSPEDERGRHDDEFAHPVRIPSPFYMAAKPVTQEQFERVMGYNPSFFSGPGDLPVEFVTWEEALQFCNALSRMEALDAVYEKAEGQWVFHTKRNGYRLPTEAEWEFACRAGTRTPFYTGRANPIPLGRDNAWRAAWHRHNARGRTQPVALREPNGWGLYDMLGNVWEWCWDWYAPYPRGVDPRITGPREGDERVIRGGGWYSTTRETRSASRKSRDPFAPWNSLGFRVARNATDMD